MSLIYLMLKKVIYCNQFNARVLNPVILVLALISIVLILQSCDNQNKKDASDFFLKANRAYQENNHAEALRLYDEAVSKNSEFADAYLNKGICLLKLNRTNDAVDNLTKAIEVDASLIQANLVRSEANIQLRNFELAKQDLKSIAKAYKDSSRFFLIRGNLMQAQDDEAGALADYDQALTLDPNNVEALVNRGAVYYHMNSYLQAKRDFLRASQLNPSQPEALNNLGLISIRDKNWKQATAYFDLILNKNPSDPLALNNKAYALLQNNDLVGAKRLLDRAVEIMPENGYALRNLGIYFQRTKQPQAALAEFSKAIDLAQNVDMLYGLTGLTYWELKNKVKACELWNQGKILSDSISIAELRNKCQ